MKFWILQIKLCKNELFYEILLLNALENSICILTVCTTERWKGWYDGLGKQFGLHLLMYMSTLSASVCSCTAGQSPTIKVFPIKSLKSEMNADCGVTHMDNCLEWLTYRNEWLAVTKGSRKNNIRKVVVAQLIWKIRTPNPFNQSRFQHLKVIIITTKRKQLWINCWSIPLPPKDSKNFANVSECK